jgi:hypothetical protein
MDWGWALWLRRVGGRRTSSTVHQLLLAAVVQWPFGQAVRNVITHHSRSLRLVSDVHAASSCVLLGPVSLA